ncbi:MAG: 4a-hydroxytetrahydrobiopterin dehydratase [bacterium]|nr:4a-hydroxytetrahydrobiopterin dehydratase [bacterium]
MTDLTKQKCVSCEGGTSPLARERVDALLREVPEWELRDGSPMVIARTLQCKNFKDACALFMRVALLCEEEGHHADIRVFGWRNIEFVLSTHAIGGLSDNDFIVAAKIDHLADH